MKSFTHFVTEDAPGAVVGSGEKVSQTGGSD